jgi:hypothetical protein
MPYLYVSNHLAAQPELAAHYLQQVYPDCCVERVVRLRVGMDRVETPHTDLARRVRGVAVVTVTVVVVVVVKSEEGS